MALVVVALPVASSLIEDRRTRPAIAVLRLPLVIGVPEIVGPVIAPIVVVALALASAPTIVVAAPPVASSCRPSSFHFGSSRHCDSPRHRCSSRPHSSRRCGFAAAPASLGSDRTLFADGRGLVAGVHLGGGAGFVVRLYTLETAGLGALGLCTRSRSAACAARVACPHCNIRLGPM